MNRNDETKEAKVNVAIEVCTQLTLKDSTSGVFTFGFSYKDVPVSASDKAIEASVIDEIEKLYQAGGTIRVANADKKTCLIDAENIGSIIIEEVKIMKEGETDEQQSE